MQFYHNAPPKMAVTVKYLNFKNFITQKSYNVMSINPLCFANQAKNMEHFPCMLRNVFLCGMIASLFTLVLYIYR